MLAAEEPARRVSETEAANAEVSASGAMRPRDEHTGHARLRRETRYDDGHLARRGLAVVGALTRDHEARARERLREPDSARNLFRPRDETRAPGTQREPRAARRSRAASAASAGRNVATRASAASATPTSSGARPFCGPNTAAAPVGPRSGDVTSGGAPGRRRGEAGATPRGRRARESVESAQSAGDRRPGCVVEPGAERRQHAEPGVRRGARAETQDETGQPRGRAPRRSPDRTLSYARPTAAAAPRAPRSPRSPRARRPPCPRAPRARAAAAATPCRGRGRRRPRPARASAAPPRPPTRAPRSCPPRRPPWAVPGNVRQGRSHANRPRGSERRRSAEGSL